MLDKWLYATERRIKNSLWRPLSQLSSSINLWPLSAGLIIGMVFAFAGQCYELVAGELETGFTRTAQLHLATTILSLVFLSAALLFANFTFSQQAQNEIIWSDQANIATDFRLRLVRAWIGWLAASAPWAGLAAGCYFASRITANNANQLEVAYSKLAVADVDMTARVPWMRVLVEREVVASIAVLVAGILVVAMIHRLRKVEWVHWVSLALLLCVFVALVLVPIVIDGGFVSAATSANRRDWVDVLREIGPLAMIALVGTCLFGVVTVVSMLSSQIGFPLVTVTMSIFIATVAFQWHLDNMARLVAIFFSALVLLGLLSRHSALAGLSLLAALLAFWTSHQWESASNQATPILTQTTRDGEPFALLPDLKLALEQWLDARRDTRKAFDAVKRPYPLLIVAAEGGGIYAASAASAALSRLQDNCSSFAQHVFAISGVSGGSVGAAIFQGLVRHQPLITTGCGDNSGPALEPVAESIVGEDHFSPLIGLTIADLMASSIDRSVGLERSFAHSYSERTKVDDLSAQFDAHWNPEMAAPALVLNSTWVETGYRVAFSPFRLSGGTDGTLYSFEGPSLKLHPSNLTIAKAAVVSARFPGIVPAYTVNRGGQNVWNFVDGGYADGSGAATALDLYRLVDRELKNINKERAVRKDAPIEIDARIILLTSVPSRTNFATINGLAAPDTLTPFTTVMSVRGLLSLQAVTRARAIDSSSANDDAANGHKVISVELDTESVQLALGWKISHVSQQLIALLIGHPRYCSRDPTVDADIDGVPESPLQFTPKISIPTIRANSCALRDVIDLLSLSRDKR